MALRTIPLTNLPDSEFTVELDRVVYAMRVTRNQRTERYFLTVATEEGDKIVADIPLVVNFPLLDRFADERLPKGSLFLWDSTGRAREATDETIGLEHLLLYQEAGT